MTVDVVVPTFNGWALTASCLRHLAAQDVAVRTIVVDNGSGDGTPDLVEEHFPAVTVVRNTDNRGFGAACNQGIAAGDGETVVLVNNDVDAPPGFTSALVAPLLADPAVGSVAGVLVEPGGEVIDNAGLSADPTLAGFARLQGAPVAQAGADRPVLLGPSGGAAAYRRTALEAVGGFDERIFLYQEDLDLALRLRAAGWATALASDAQAIHLGSATAGRRSAFQREQAGWARGYLLRRYGVRTARALVTEAVVVTGDAVLSRDVAALRGRLRGWRAARGLPRRAVPDGIDHSIGLRASLALRRGDYAAATRSTARRVP